MPEAFSAALRQWPREGVPTNPCAWLVSARRFKAIDTIRRLGRYAEARVSYQHALSLTTQAPARRFLKQRLSELPT